MYEDAFTKFDPVFAIPFLKNVASSYIHTDVRLSDGRVGKVILINDSARHKPVVQVDGEYIDLSKKKDLNITALLQKRSENVSSKYEDIAELQI